MLTVRYFASVRESVGVTEETVRLPETVSTVGEFISWMRSQGLAYELAFGDTAAVRSAVDRVHATLQTPLRDAREIAFFPMMTGG